MKEIDDDDEEQKQEPTRKTGRTGLTGMTADGKAVEIQPGQLSYALGKPLTEAEFKGRSTTGLFAPEARKLA